MYSTTELTTLAVSYIRATGIAPSTLGMRCAGNDKLFIRMFRGLDCTARSAERASRWFNENWPSAVPWPKSVPRQSFEKTRRGGAALKVATA
jgi:hypothetical protein